jgi:glucosamine-6-phosphate deaminase
MSKLAAEIMIDVVKNKPNATMGFATGTTPLGLYEYMIKDHKENGTSYKQVKTLNLDEYVGLEGTHNQSYKYFMKHNLFDSLDLDQNNINIENGMAQDIEQECARYTALIQSMPQDIQLLGLGSNGHIAFNEPNTPFGSTTHIVNLTENTIKDNSRLFNSIDEVPRQALTMGIKDIMNAKKLLVIANGKNKQQAVYETVYGKVDENVPSSVLKLHPDCTLIVDADAGALLNK